MNKRLKYSIAMFIIGLVISGGIAYVIVYAVSANFVDMLSSNECESAYPESVEGFAGIQLPPSATNLQSNCSGMQGMWAEAYFDMKPSDLNVFVDSTKVKLPLSTTGKPNKLECYPCNRLTELKSYLYGVYNAEEWFEEIFIDTSNSVQWRVYFTVLAG